MSSIRALGARLHGLFAHGRLERELDEEVRFHLEMLIDEHIKAGLSPAEARHAALRIFGAVEPMKEAYRERRAFIFAETILQDVRNALRALGRNPSFTIVSVAVLAMAIGVNTAMFSVLHAVLLRPLPYRDPEQLAMLWTERPSQNLREGRSAYWNIEQWRAQSRSFSALAVLDPISATYTTATGSEQISAARVSSNFLSLLGVRPLRGRMFSAQEAEDQQPLVLISHRFWQSRFAASPDAIGASITVDGTASRIIGILPTDFEFASDGPDVWGPHTLTPNWQAVRTNRGAGSWFVIGRLQPDVTLARAQAEMDAIARRLDDQMPGSDRNLGISVVPLSLHMVGPRSRLALWMLAGAVLCVLLVAATNVASLSLARSVSRQREFAIRSALGASRARIVQQLLIESLTLTFVAGLLGLLVALAAIRLILLTTPGKLARLNEVALDPRVLVGSLALCVLTGLLVGLAPAITTVRWNIRALTQDGGRGMSSGVGARRIRRGLVTAEFALAILLLVAAGLLIRSLWSIDDVELGYQPKRVLSLQFAYPAGRPSNDRADFYERILSHVRSVPGVESAAIIGDFFFNAAPEQIVTIEESGGTHHLRLRRDEMTANLFKTVGAPLLRGRLFSSEDRPSSPRVVIINETMAHKLWPGADPIGKRFSVVSSNPNVAWLTVVGIVGDMRRQGHEQEPVAQIFEPLAQNPSRLETLVVRTSTDDPLSLSKAVQTAARRVDKFTTIYGANTFELRLGDFLAQRRLQTSLLLGFSLFALLMAAVGIYGLIHYSVATRTHEIGIRMALGAETRTIFSMIISEGLKLSVTGVFIGVITSLWLGRIGSNLLFGVTPADPLTFGTVSVLLIAVAMAASYFPARRATKVEPIVALRHV